MLDSFLYHYFIERSLYQGSPYLPALNWMSQIRMDEYLTKVVQILLKFVLSFSPKPVSFQASSDASTLTSSWLSITNLAP